MELKPFCHLDHKSFFGHIRGKQESCEKHISDCKTEVECEARNMKTLRSRENLFIKYPSVGHSLPSNRQQSLIHVWCIIRSSHYKTYPAVWQQVPPMCVWACGFPLSHIIHTYIRNLILECISLDKKWGKHHVLWKKCNQESKLFVRCVVCLVQRLNSSPRASHVCL